MSDTRSFPFNTRRFSAFAVNSREQGFRGQEDVKKSTQKRGAISAQIVMPPFNPGCRNHYQFYFAEAADS